MKYADELNILTELFTPLSLKVLLLLADGGKTKKDMYAACSNWNNTLVKSTLDSWKNNGVITGGEQRGEEYRLTLKGRGVTDWLLEGGIIV